MIKDDASEKKLAQMDAVWDTTYIFRDLDTFLEKNTHHKLGVTNLTQNHLEYVIICVEYDKSF